LKRRLASILKDYRIGAACPADVRSMGSSAGKVLTDKKLTLSSEEVND